MNRRVGIISYGTGNLASLADAFGSIGATCTLVNTASDLAGSDALVLPGVGHFRHAMNFLRSSGLLQPTMDRINGGIPTLGICLGFQLLSMSSEEGDGDRGLGILPFPIARIRPQMPHLHKVPHLGWNAIHHTFGSSRLLNGIPSEDQVFYYANAYAAKWTKDLAQPLATFSHGEEFIALIEQDSVFGVQFHPEKSRAQGLRLLKNFLEN